MNPWQILGLEPTRDLKAIKKAYAVLVKKNKPDEAPEAFAALHAAYKRCSAMAKRMAEESGTEREISGEPSRVLGETELSNFEFEPVQIMSTSPEPVFPSRLADEASAQIEQERDLSQTETINQPLDIQDDVNPIDFDNAQKDLIASTEQALEQLQQSDSIEPWLFVEQAEALYDFGFKDGYSEYVIEQLLGFFKGSEVKPKKRVAVIMYLNSQFDWLSQVQRYEYDYGYEEIAPIFDILTDAPQIEERSLKWFVEPRHVGPIEAANYYGRLAATAFDGIVFWLCVSPLLGNMSFGEKVIVAMVAFIALKAILEASPLQGSVGQVLFGIKVTSKKGRRLHVLHSIWRQLMYAGSMFGFKITVWINFFLGGGRLLHDRLSGTLVIKRY